MAKDKIVLTIVTTIMFIRFSTSGNSYEDILNSNDDYEEDYEEPYTEPENCICVPYYQCKEDFSGLVEDGVDIMDLRISVGDGSGFYPPAKPIPGLQDAPRPLGQAKCGDVDVCCPIECGRTYNDLPSADTDDNGLTDRMYQSPISYRITDDLTKARVLQSKTANFAEFPWMLGVLHGKVYRCGGSLIHPQVAITAAHCVSNDKTSSNLRARSLVTDTFIVRAGEWNWEATDEPMAHQDQTTKKVLIHSQYDPPSLRNDIALLILETPFKLSANVAIACIATKPPVDDSSKCVVSGWGKNGYRNGVYQSTLKKMSLPLVPHRKCLQSLRNARLGPTFQLHRSFICAGEGFKDTCKGDGGSPLMCPISGVEGRYEQVGIVSWGLTCGMQNTPGVYVNVAMFSNWIDMNMRENNFDTTVYKHKSTRT